MINKQHLKFSSRPAAGEDSSGLVVMGGSGSGGGVGVFLITTQDVSVGQELMFWAHDPTLAWSRKKMEKTSEYYAVVTVGGWGM